MEVVVCLLWYQHVVQYQHNVLHPLLGHGNYTILDSNFTCNKYVYTLAISLVLLLVCLQDLFLIV